MRLVGASDVTGAGGFARVSILVALLVLVQATGCSVRKTTFDIVDHRGPSGVRHYRETFGEAYYDLDAQGNVDIVLRRTSPGDAGSREAILQVIHIRGVWRSIPGDTAADRTLINATVRYRIVSGGVGASFEGAGALLFGQDRRGTTLTGELDSAVLRPRRWLTGGIPLFERAELSGAFRAQRDPRRVVRIVNDMDRLFAPRSTMVGRASSSVR